MEVKAFNTFQEYGDNFTKRVVYQKDGSVVFVLNFKPGQQLPPHKHPGTQVYILVLEGTGIMIADGKEYGVKKDDIVNCGGEEQFAFKNTGDSPVSLYVCLNKIPNELYTQNI